MADSEIQVKFTADIKDIKDSLKKIEDSSEKTGNVISDTFGSAAGKMALFTGSIGLGIQAVEKITDAIKKITVELAIVGERAAQVENGFKNFAESAGIAGDELLNKVLQANNGVIETTELLGKSSQLIVAFGKSAERLPEILELSRKIAVSYGIDASDAFERLSTSIQNGSQRGLKNLGIIVDTEKAVRDYARAHDIAVNALTEAGRAQAILNAALEQGQNKFHSVSLQQETVSDTWHKLNNSVQDFIELIGNSIARTGVLQSAFDLLTSALHSAGDGFRIAFGTEAEKAKGQIGGLENALKLLNEELEKINSGHQPLVSRLFGRSKEDVIKDIQDVQNKLAETRAKAGVGEQFGPPAPGGAAGGGEVTNDQVNKEQLKKNEIQFRQQINQIRLQSAQEAIKIATDETDLYAAQQDRVAALDEQLAIKKQEIRDSQILSESQKNQMLEELETQHQQNLLAIEMQAEDERIAMLQNRVYMAQTIDEQIASSAELQAARTAQAWKRSGQLGGIAVQAFSNRTMAAFAAVGAGTATMAEALRSAFFGMLGDVASAQGKTMFLTNLAPPLGPNPAGMAAGLGLIALGGLLSSMGGGAKLGGGGVGGGGGAGGGPEGGFGGPSIGDAKDRRKEVTINIEGNYFDSQETKLSIVEAVRSASDANDFTIQRGNRR